MGVYLLYNDLAEIYDEIYRQIFDYDWEAKIIHDAFSKRKIRDVLDAGVGTGRLAARLLEKGYKVTGVDVSEEMLKIAARNAPGAKLIRADLRKLPFHNEFDGIVCMGRVTTYMTTDEDMHALLSSFHRATRNRGIVVIDAFDLDMLKKEFSKYGRRREVFNTSVGKIIRESVFRWESESIFQWTARYIIGNVEHIDVQTLRAFSKDEFAEYLEANGFSVAKMIDAPPSIAPAFVVIAERKK